MGESSRVCLIPQGRELGRPPAWPKEWPVPGYERIAYKGNAYKGNAYKGNAYKGNE